MKTTKYIITLAFTVWCALGNLYAVTPTYYNAVDGKSGKNLFDAVHTVAKTGYKGLTYDGLWTAYCAIDINSSDKVWDMYSNATAYTCGGSAQGASYSKEGDSYNREHSIPKSWFGSSTSKTTPGTDLFHVVPTDGYVNNRRSNYAFGEVASATYTSQSGCKLGSPKSISISNSILNASGSSSQSCSTSKVFEPMDEYKGDFARGYFGTMVRWANDDYQKFTTGDGAAIFNTAYDAAHYYGLTGYGVALLLKWHREDPVSQKEVERNDGIQSQQGNRNPFIDYPELVEYIWGNHTGETVTLSNLTPTFEGYTPPATTTYTVILSRNGATEAITGQSDTYNLPAKNTESAACDNWAFDGWATIKVNETTTRPNYVTSVSSASTVYAVYAKTESAGSAPHRATMATSTATYTFTSKSWAATEGNWTSGKAGNGYSNSGVQVTNGTSGANATCPTSYSNISSIVVSYCTNSSSGAGTIVMSVGETKVSQSVSKDGGTTARNLTFDFSSTKPTGTPKITVTCTTNSIYVCGVTINYGTSGGSTTTTYYASEPEECNCSGKLPTPTVTATPSDGTITLTWSDVTNATNGYSVTINKGVGYTTECGAVEIGEVSHSGTTNTCVITGLVNGLEYTASVVANTTATICESDAGTATATPVGCSQWDITFGYSTYTLTAGGATVSPTITGTQHGAVTYESSNTSVLTVNASGVVTPVSAGTATVTAHWAGADGYCPKDVTTPTFTVNGKVTVTFDMNDGSGTTTTQQVDYNTATALTANTFSRTGYTFQGWALTADGTKVYNDCASITITAATTLYAVWQVNTHKVTFSPSPTGATVKVNNSSSSPVNNVAYGSTVTIVITPVAHYSIGSVTADGGVAVTGSGSNWSFTMPDKDVAINVTMVEDTKYTVTWYVTDTPTEEVNYAGEALAGISDPTIDCNGKVFVGWTATADYSDATIAPADLFTDASTKTMPSNNSTNYYAVFARESAGEPVLTNNYKKITTTSEFSTGNYLIVANHSDTYKAMSTTWKDTYYLSYVTVTPSNDVISTTDGTIIWNIAVSNNQASIYNATSKYLYIEQSGSYYNIKLGDNTTANKFTYGVSSGNWLFTSVTYNTRVLEFYTDRDRWTYHTAADAPVYLYKQQSNSSTTYSDYSTSCSEPVLYEITVNDTEHGSVTTSPSGTAASGSTVTVTITPNEWYNLATLTVVDANGSPITVNGEGNTRTFTMPESNVAISATFVEKQKYSINFYVEGTLASSQNVYEGSTPNVPSDLTPCDGGYTFVGWWTNTLDADNTTAHTWITDFTVSQAQDYYAVFSYSEGGGASSVTDVLTRATTGITGTSYSGWSGKTLASGAVYAGQSAGGNESIQLRSDKSNSGIITTASGGKVTKVTVEWNSNTTSDRTLNVYGKNTAYSAATDLYGDNAGTLLGTIVYGTSTELTVTGDYAYIGLRSASGAMYLTSVSVTWSAAGASTTYYTTSTCSEPEPIMMVSELDGLYFAVTHEITDSAIAALELIGLDDTYYYKPGTNIADITWYIQRGRASNYLSNSTGQYLAVHGKNIAMRAERFAWTVNDAGQFVTAENTGLCYDSKNRAFVVADKTGNDANNWHLSVSASVQSLNALQEANTYTRSGVTDDQYITICLPYAVSQTFLETADVYNVTGKFVSGSKVTGVALTPEEGILEAGRPYVVHTLSSPLNAYYGEITAAEVVPALGLVGNLSEEPLAVPAGCYGLSNSRLRLVTEGGRATTGQYKAYFDLRDVPEVSSTNLPMGSKTIYSTDTTETPTDVDALFGNSSQINWQLPVYNVLGIQVGEDATGVLIQNGIKFLKY